MNPSPSPQAQKPNVVFILCDNVGWGSRSVRRDGTHTGIDKLRVSAFKR